MTVQVGLIGLIRDATVRERFALQRVTTPNRRQTVLSGLIAASADTTTHTAWVLDTWICTKRLIVVKHALVRYHTE